jgi:purine-cytosine permease-like protein
MVNRTQAIVLWFVLAAWLSLIVILVTAPEVYDDALPVLGHRRAVEIAFLMLLSAFLGFLAVGVLRRWRWMFWFILIAFGLGLVRAPVAVLQLLDMLAPAGPAWYVVFQGVIGVIQFVIALVMLADYRRCGVWGAG